jgi:hypothetical protein
MGSFPHCRLSRKPSPRPPSRERTRRADRGEGKSRGDCFSTVLTLRTIREGDRHVVTTISSNQVDRHSIGQRARHRRTNRLRSSATTRTQPSEAQACATPATAKAGASTTASSRLCLGARPLGLERTSGAMGLDVWPLGTPQRSMIGTAGSVEPVREAKELRFRRTSVVLNVL